MLESYLRYSKHIVYAFYQIVIISKEERIMIMTNRAPTRQSNNFLLKCMKKLVFNRIYRPYYFPGTNNRYKHLILINF